MPIIDMGAYHISLRRLEKLGKDEQNLTDIVETTFDFEGIGEYKSIESLQKKKELIKLAQIVSEIEPEIVIEIGTANGGTFYVWNRAFDRLEKAISLDLPGGQFGGGYSASQAKFFSNFSEADIETLRANSHEEDTKQNLRDRLSMGSAGFLFIDGDHTYEGVKQDFEMYKDFVREGGIIAFHDIVPHPNDPDCNVDKFWNEIKENYETEEIIWDESQEWAGIGIIYR